MRIFRVKISDLLKIINLVILHLINILQYCLYQLDTTIKNKADLQKKQINFYKTLQLQHTSKIKVKSCSEEM